MADSLVLDGIELLGADDDPEYRLSRDYDLSYAAPDTTQLLSKFLDGERIIGRRSRNREIELVIWVRGRTRIELAQLVARLAVIVDKAQFRLTLTLDGGLPMQWTCYRGSAVPEWSFLRSQQSLARLTLRFPASPFGRSPDTESITVTGAQVQLDSFETLPEATVDYPTYSSNGSRTSDRYQGTYALLLTWRINLDVTRAGASTVVRTLSSPVNLSAAATVQIQTHASADYYTGNAYDVSWHYTLHLYSHGGTRGSSYVNDIATARVGRWEPVSFSLSSAMGSGSLRVAVDLRAVTSYKLVVEPKVRFGSNNEALRLKIDDMRAMPAASAAYSVDNGGVYTISGVKGTARAPVSIELVRPTSSVFNAAVVHRAPAGVRPGVIPIIQLARPVTGVQSVTLLPDREFDGNYSVVLVAGLFGFGSRTLRATFTQHTPVNPDSGIAGTTTTARAVQRTFTPAQIPLSRGANDSPGQPTFVKLGQLTLPLVGHPDENTASHYSVHVQQIGGLEIVGSEPDLFSALLMLDVAGQTVMAYPRRQQTRLYLDAPAPGEHWGHPYSGRDRRNATSIMDETDIDGGPMSLEPGTNALTVYCPSGSLDLTARYVPHWITERTL